MKLIPLAICVILSGCASTSMLQGMSVVRVDAPDDKSYDYKLLMQNRVEVGWNGNNAADRMRTARDMYGRQCPRMTVKETPISAGSYTFGDPAVTWVMKIKCNKEKS